MKKLMLMLVVGLLVAGSAQAAPVNDWSLNESPILGGTTAAVDSVSGDDGVYSDYGVTPATGRPGGDGGAKFDGNTGGVGANAAAHTAAEISNSTLVMWFKADSGSLSGERWLYNEASGVAIVYGLSTVGTSLRFNTIGSTGFDGLFHTATLAEGQWYMAAAVMDAGGAGKTLYLWDGTNLTSVSNAGVQDITSDNTEVGIGNVVNHGAGRWDGELDDVQFYNHSMTAGEVANLIPEPATMALLGLGSLAMLRRKKA